MRMRLLLNLGRSKSLDNWRGKPAVLVGDFEWVNRGTVVARGTVVIRPWGLAIHRASWRRSPAGKERVVFPYFAAGNSSTEPSPIITWANKQLARRVTRAALSAFHTAAAAHPDTESPRASAAARRAETPRIPIVATCQGAAPGVPPGIHQGEK